MRYFKTATVLGDGTIYNGIDVVQNSEISDHPLVVLGELGENRKRVSIHVSGNVEDYPLHDPAHPNRIMGGWVYSDKAYVASCITPAAAAAPPEGMYEHRGMSVPEAVLVRANAFSGIISNRRPNGRVFDAVHIASSVKIGSEVFESLQRLEHWDPIPMSQCLLARGYRALGEAGRLGKQHDCLIALPPRGFVLYWPNNKPTPLAIVNKPSANALVTVVPAGDLPALLMADSV
jgi:hypothetical protein